MDNKTLKKNKLIKKHLAILIISIFQIPSFAELANKTEIVELNEFYKNEITRLEKSNKKLEKLSEDIIKSIEFLPLEEQQLREKTSLIKNINIKIKNIKNLYEIKFDEKNNPLKESLDEIEYVRIALDKDAIAIKILTSDGIITPLIKYKVKTDDTIKKILLKTYPKEFTPTWLQASKRIDTLIEINKDIIKMNYIYPNQEIYIPMFKEIESLK